MPLIKARTGIALLLLSAAAAGAWVLTGYSRRSRIQAWATRYEAAYEASIQTAHADAEAPAGDYFSKLADAALEQTKHTVVYDPAYVRIGYPNGDVPQNRGVCADVVIRAYRSLGSDLQKLVHEDMTKSFAEYPQAWGLKRPDTNIDHRRVLNLMTFFTRAGSAVKVSERREDYKTGDIVAWDLGTGGLTHIGIVYVRGGKPLVVHNIGAGPRLEDVLFSWKKLGVYRYRPAA